MPAGRLRPLPAATVATGGAGGSANAANDPLGSQHSLVHDDGKDLLFAANAGDNTVTVFDTSEPSGRPILAHEAGFVYTANTGSNTISFYRVSRTGELTLVNGAEATAGTAPADITFAGGGSFLYSLNPLSGDISGLAINRDSGHLRPVETQGGLPIAAGIQGIAARDF